MAASNTADTEFKQHDRSLEHINNIIADLNDVRAKFTSAGILTGSATWDAASIADGDEEVKEVTVTGAELGDFVLVSASIDVADLSLVAQVTATNVVTCQLGNWTGGAIDLASMTVSVIVLKASAFAAVLSARLATPT